MEERGGHQGELHVLRVNVLEKRDVEQQAKEDTTIFDKIIITTLCPQWVK